MSEPRILRCKCCREWKPESHFHTAPENKSGRAGTCKPCRRVQMREYAQARKAHIQAILANAEKREVSDADLTFRTPRGSRKQNWPAVYKDAPPLPPKKQKPSGDYSKQPKPVDFEPIKSPIIAEHDRHSEPSTSSPDEPETPLTFTDIFKLK